MAVWCGISEKREPDLMAKLNAVANHEHLLPNTLLKQILHKQLNQMIKDLNITVSGKQSASDVG